MYANEDGIFEEDLTYIEVLRMPQPYPKQHEIYQHKPLPPSLYPQHRGDVRYNFDFSAWPRRHFTPDNRVNYHI